MVSYSQLIYHSKHFVSKSGTVNICEIKDEVKQALRDFRFRKDKVTAALICKYEQYLSLELWVDKVDFIQ